VTGTRLSFLGTDVDGGGNSVAHRFPALIAALAAGQGRIWLVLQRGVPVAGQLPANPDFPG
jgi:hypothetical protein